MYMNFLWQWQICSFLLAKSIVHNTRLSLSISTDRHFHWLKLVKVIKKNNQKLWMLMMRCSSTIQEIKGNQECTVGSNYLRSGQEIICRSSVWLPTKCSDTGFSGHMACRGGVRLESSDSAVGAWAVRMLLLGKVGSTIVQCLSFVLHADIIRKITIWLLRFSFDLNCKWNWIHRLKVMRYPLNNTLPVERIVPL